MKRIALLLAACGAKATQTPAPTKPHDAPRCPGVAVLAKPLAGTTYPSWLAAWQALAHPRDGTVLLPAGASPPADDAGAKALLCGDGGCPDTGPWIVGAGTPGDRIAFSLVMPSGAGLIGFADLAGGAGGRCQYQDDIDTTPGRYFAVTVMRNQTGVAGYTDSMSPLGPGNLAAGTVPTAPGDADCAKPSGEVDYLWFDAEAGTRVLAIITDSGVAVTATARGVHVVAGGCTEDLPL